MLDIMLNADGDIRISVSGDISTTESIRQAVRVKLRWIYGEWRLGPELGFPWFEEVFVKNPNVAKIKSLIRDKVLEVSGVDSVSVAAVNYDQKERTVSVKYTVTIGKETFREELTLYEQLWPDA